MNDYPFNDFSPREIAVSMVPKPNLDEAMGLPSDTGTGNSFGDTVGMMIPPRNISRKAAASRTHGLMIDPPTGDSLAGDGTRGMMPGEPEVPEAPISPEIECTFPPLEPEEEEIPINPGSAELSPEARRTRHLTGFMTPGKELRMDRRVESKKQQMAIGTKIEKEHTEDPKKASKIASDHVNENPRYYPTTRKPKGNSEKLTWVSKVPKPPKE